MRHCFDLARKRGSDIVVTLDADGQHDPDDIPSLVIPIQASEADIVIGSRTMNMKALKSMGLVTFTSNRLSSPACYRLGMAVTSRMFRPGTEHSVSLRSSEYFLV